MRFLTDRINNKLEKSNVINEHALNREPVPLIVSKLQIDYFFLSWLGSVSQTCIVMFSLFQILTELTWPCFI